MVDNDMRPVVGIDLGTTYSCIYRWNGREPEIYVNKIGERTTPSLVYYGENETLVGSIARRKGGIDPKHIISKIKREMGMSDYSLDIRGKKLTPVDISSEIIKKLVNDVNMKYPKSSGFGIEGAIITVPYYFKAPERNATLEAGKQTGLNILGLFNEPTAAALIYGWNEFKHKTESKPETIVVFDLGGGTFDVTVFRVFNEKEKLTFEVLATGGDARLGGTDFDESMQEYVMQSSGISLDGLTELEKLKTVTLLNEAVITAKHDLSACDMTYITIANFVRDQHIDMTITKEQFKDVISKHLDRIRCILEDTFYASKVERGGLDRVIKIGGSSKIPIMDEIIEEVTGSEPWGNIGADEAVAAGAALYSAILDGRVDFEKEIEVKEIVSHALGVKTGVNNFTKLIPDGKPTPCEVSEIFGTTEDNANQVDIEVYQGRGNSVDDKGVTKIGHVLVKGLIPKSKGELDIKITFKVNNDQNISVIIEQPESGIYVSENLRMAQ
jgi:molecular chaperone DnaK (HSP70)